MNSQTQTDNRPKIMTGDDLARVSRARITQVSTNQTVIDGGNLSINLPRTGLGVALMLSIQGTVTVGGTVTGGKFAGYPYPAPLSLIKRLRLNNGGGVLISETSGWGRYKYNRYRHGVDPFQPVPALFSAQSAVTTGKVAFSGTSLPVAGANVAAGTYTFNQMIPIPISYNKTGDGGLLILANNSQYQLSIDFGNIAGGISSTGGTNDVFAGLTGTSLTISSNLTASLSLEFFDTPPDTINYSALTSYMVAVNEFNSPLQVGSGKYTLPVVDFYSMILAELVNNGAAVFDSSITDSALQVSSQLVLTKSDRYTQVMRDFYQHDGLTGMDGVLCFDMGLRRGTMDRRDFVDVINNQQITDLALYISTPNTLVPVAPAQVSIVTESLRLSSNV